MSYSSEIDLRRDEPPTQADLDERAKCEWCGARLRYHTPRVWDCHKCGGETKREIV